MSSNSYLNFIIEWQFCAALLSLMLLASYKLIRNPFLASSFLKASFTLMLVLPIICLLLQNSGFYMFAIFEASPPEAHPKTSLVVASSASSTTPAEIAKTAKTASLLNAANIALFIILIYAAASLVNLVVSYCRLRKFCLKQQAYRTLNNIPVYTSQSSAFPFCFGLFRPLIVIPQALTNDESDLETVLNHEKAHIDNKDHLYCVVQNLVKALYIINPVVWYLNRRFSVNQEILADYLASEAVGNKERYVHSLLNLVKSSQWLGTPKLATGMAASKEQLMTRINVILTGENNMMKTTPNWKKNCVVLGLAGLASISLTTKLTAEEKPEEPNNKNVELAKPNGIEPDQATGLKEYESYEAFEQVVKDSIAEKMAKKSDGSTAAMISIGPKDLSDAKAGSEVKTKIIRIDKNGQIIGGESDFTVSGQTGKVIVIDNNSKSKGD